VAVKCNSGTDSPTTRIPSIADTSEPSSQQPTVSRSQNQPGHIPSDVVDQANQQQQLEIKPQEKLADRADLIPPSESDQADDCKADNARSLNNNSSFVAKVFPMTTSDLETSPPSSSDISDPTGQCQDDDEDESMNIQPMTIFPASKGLGKRHEYSNGPSQSFHESPTTVKRAANTSYADPLDGYLSEGGASLYARKLHYLAVTQRNKDEDR
jgi:hypothetical protein